MEATRKRVVVIGAGFGGLTFCQHFSHPDALVSVIDRTNHHLFQPLLYQVAMAGLAAPDIAQPIRSILAGQPQLEVLMSEVKAIDLAGRRLVCGTRELSYDYLVLAFGSVTSYFGRADWARYAPGLKTIEDALAIRRNVLLAFERAESESDPREQERLMTIVIVGGGPTGVELAGAYAELAHFVLRKDFDHIDPRRARIILIEGSPEILSHFPPDLSAKARRKLERMGVEVRTGCRVHDLAPGVVTLSTGEQLRAENVLWAAGVMAHPLTKQLGVELDRAGRVKVQPDLSVPGHPEVFAIGDAAYVQQADGTLVPGVAPAAMQMARHVASVLNAELRRGHDGEPRPAFHYRDKGTMATIGRKAGIAVFGRLKLAGFLAWLMWLGVHLIFLIGFRNRISVLFSWTYSYFTYKLGSRIITGWPPSLSQEHAAEQPPHPRTGSDKNLVWR